MEKFKEILESIQKDLAISKSFSREALYEECIQTKLVNIVKAYNRDADLNTNYLLRRASEKVLKSLTKIQKSKDKEILNKYLNNNQ